MNHDPGPSSAARQLPRRPDRDDDTRDRHGRPEESNDDRHSRPDGGPSPSSQRQEKRREGLAKKLEFVSHLQKSLDMTVFVYICTLYYME